MHYVSFVRVFSSVAKTVHDDCRLHRTRFHRSPPPNPASCFASSMDYCRVFVWHQLRYSRPKSSCALIRFAARTDNVACLRPHHIFLVRVLTCISKTLHVDGTPHRTRCRRSRLPSTASCVASSSGWASPETYITFTTSGASECYHF